jgi:AraC-like DNA-binding protein
MKLLNSAPGDTVTELLSRVRVSSSIYCLSELGAPWGFEVDGTDFAKFHLVIDGACWLRLDGVDPVRLHARELVILPRGERHAISDQPGSPVVGLDQLIATYPLDTEARMQVDGHGARTTLLCGGFALTDPVPAQIMTMLPPLLKIGPGPDDMSSWIDPVFELIRHEASHSAPGAQAVFTRLADVLLVQAIRSHLAEAVTEADHGQPPDARIEQAAALIRDQPARPWTLQALAREVGMSRTSFTTSFRAATGESPMRHLARVRLTRAAGYLLTDDLSIEAIAKRTGYASNASLSKAFRREYGSSPGAYRASARHLNGHRAPASPPVG